MALEGIRRGGLSGTLLAAAGCGLVVQAATGTSIVEGLPRLAEPVRRSALSLVAAQPAFVRQAVTIGKPREELYRFWRDFTNLPRMMPHLDRVEILDDRRSRWTAWAPGGGLVSWEAEIEDDLPNERIAWRSVGESEIRNAGVVEFRDAPGGRGTEVHVLFRYQPPMGTLGRGVAWLSGEEPRLQVKDALRRLKQILETGEAPTVEGQPHGRRHWWESGR